MITHMHASKSFTSCVDLNFDIVIADFNTNGQARQDGTSQHHIEFRTPQTKKLEPSQNGIETYVECIRLRGKMESMFCNLFIAKKSLHTVYLCSTRTYLYRQRVAVLIVSRHYYGPITVISSIASVTIRN